MIDVAGRGWVALTVLTFKRRIAQAFIIVVAIVVSLMTISVVIVESAASRRHTEESGKIYFAALELQDGIEHLVASADALGMVGLEEADKLLSSGEADVRRDWGCGPVDGRSGVSGAGFVPAEQHRR